SEREMWERMLVSGEYVLWDGRSFHDLCRIVSSSSSERRREIFAESSDPGGSRNGSTEMCSYRTSITVRYSVPPGASRTTLSPAADFINARPSGDTQLMWLRLRSTSSVPTMLTTRSAPAALA